MREDEDSSDREGEEGQKENRSKKKLNGHGEGGGREEGGSGESEGEEVNIFTPTVLEGKRKRFAPIAETLLQAWLELYLSR